jgi:hypothetical protein
MERCDLDRSKDKKETREIGKTRIRRDIHIKRPKRKESCENKILRLISQRVKETARLKD